MDAKVLLLAADLSSDAWDAHMRFAHRLIHTVSKLHAMALQQLRGEPELTSLTLCPIAHSSQVSCNLLSLHCVCISSQLCLVNFNCMRTLSLNTWWAGYKRRFLLKTGIQLPMFAAAAWTL